MSKRTKIIDDDTGDEITDFIHITIERPGYMIVLPNGDKTNMAILDLSAAKEIKILKKLTYEKLDPALMMRSL
jgi:hypothetical protein